MKLEVQPYLAPSVDPVPVSIKKVIVKMIFPQQPPTTGKMKHPKLLYYMIHKFSVGEQRVTSETKKLNKTQNVQELRINISLNTREGRKRNLRAISSRHSRYNYKNNTHVPDAELQCHRGGDPQGKEWKEKKAAFTKPLWKPPRTAVESNLEEGGSREYM